MATLDYNGFIDCPYYDENNIRYNNYEEYCYMNRIKGYRLQIYNSTPYITSDGNRYISYDAYSQRMYMDRSYYGKFDPYTSVQSNDVVLYDSNIYTPISVNKKVLLL